MDGFIGVVIAAEQTVRITFESLKTDREKITAALLQGGVTVSGEADPATGSAPPKR